MAKNPPASAGDSRGAGSIPGSARSPGEGTAAHSIQYACLGNPMDGGAWWATVHGVAELDTAELLSTRIQEKRVSIQGWRAVRLGLLTEKF